MCVCVCLCLPVCDLNLPNSHNISNFFFISSPFFTSLAAAQSSSFMLLFYLIGNEERIRRRGRRRRTRRRKAIESRTPPLAYFSPFLSSSLEWVFRPMSAEVRLDGISPFLITLSARIAMPSAWNFRRKIRWKFYNLTPPRWQRRSSHSHLFSSHSSMKSWWRGNQWRSKNRKKKEFSREKTKCVIRYLSAA